MVTEIPIESDTAPDESAEPKVSEGSEEISEAVQDAQAHRRKQSPRNEAGPKKQNHHHSRPRRNLADQKSKIRHNLRRNLQCFRHMCLRHVSTAHIRK